MLLETLRDPPEFEKDYWALQPKQGKLIKIDDINSNASKQIIRTHLGITEEEWRELYGKQAAPVTASNNVFGAGPGPDSLNLFN